MIESCSSAQYQSFWFMLAVSNPMGFLAQKVIHPCALPAASPTMREYKDQGERDQVTQCIGASSTIAADRLHSSMALARYLASACCRRCRQLGAPRVYDGVDHRVQLLHCLPILQVVRCGQPLRDNEAQGRTPCKVLECPLYGTCMW